MWETPDDVNQAILAFLKDDGRRTIDDGRKVRKISSVRDLEVYRLAFDTAMEIFEIKKRIPFADKGKKKIVPRPNE